MYILAELHRSTGLVGAQVEHHVGYVERVADAAGACGPTLCLEDIPVPEIPLPEGFEAHYANFVVKGICKNCR